MGSEVTHDCPRCGEALREGWTGSDYWVVTLSCDGCGWATPIFFRVDSAVEYVNLYSRVLGPKQKGGTDV